MIKKEADKEKYISAPKELPELASDKYPLSEIKLPSLNNTQPQSVTDNSPKPIPSLASRMIKKELPVLPVHEEEPKFESKELEQPREPQQIQSNPQTPIQQAAYTQPAPQQQIPIQPVYIHAAPQPVYIAAQTQMPVQQPAYFQQPVLPTPQPVIEKPVQKEIQTVQKQVVCVPSFFQKFEDLFTDKNTDQSKIIEEIMKKDLLHKMREYHDSLGTETPFYLHSKDLISGVSDRIVRLQLLENEWYQLRGELKELQKQVNSKEEEINDEVNKLKNLFFLLKIRENINKKITPEQYFKLEDDEEFRTIEELLIGLKSMKKKTYEYHVNEYKNDFANWVEGVFGLKELADKMRSLKNKEDTIKLLNLVTF